MKRKPHIFVFRLKEIIYTLIFLALGGLLIFLLIHMFRSGNGTLPSSSPLYTPGIYSSTFSLGEQDLNVEVTVSADKIQSVRFVQLNESISTMYPLMEPVMENLETQILASQSLDQLVSDDSYQYTSAALQEVIETTLEKAKK